MKKKYDKAIDEHYKKVANETGYLSTSTMADEITRNLETKAIMAFVGECLRLRQERSVSSFPTIVDIGCGNGYTLEKIQIKYPKYNYFGIEKSDDLRALASSRFKGNDKVKILEGDIRDKDFAKGITADILICQRVIINLLDLEDQKNALNNIIDFVSPRSNGVAGNLLFIECFDSSLVRLNEARSEYDLAPVPPAHHNLYLPDNFFQLARLKTFISESLVPPNFLSTHYYVTRVLHPMLTPGSKEFKRGSEFVRFFTEALNQNIGDYSPLKLFTFERAD